jgi:hypothetical protein
VGNVRSKSCQGIVACDFFVSVTATFKIVYVFVAMEIGSRRILHLNTTEHPPIVKLFQVLDFSGFRR